MDLRLIGVVPFGIVALEQIAMRRRAGIVDEDIDMAELRDDGVDELRHFMRVAQIAGKGEGIARPPS